MIEKILHLYQADTSDHKAKIKELSGEQKKLAQEHLNALEKQNAAIENHIKTVGRISVAVGAVAVAGKLLWEGWEHNARKAQLANNVLGENVVRLRAGFDGLRSEMQALEAVNKLSHGTYKLTGDQMEMVGKAMRQLVREGHDWDEVTNKVTDAFVKLNGGGLDDFGIHVREATTDGEKFAAILEAMTSKSDKLGSQSKTSAEKMVEMKTRFTDAMDAVKSSLGDIAVAFLPIIEALAKVAGLAGKIASVGGGILKYTVGIPGLGLSAMGDLGGWMFGDKGTLGGLAGNTLQNTQLASGARSAFDSPFSNQSQLQSGNPFLKDLNLADAIGGGASALRLLTYLGGEEAQNFLGKLAKKSKEAGAAGKRARAQYDKIWNDVIAEMIEGAAPQLQGQDAILSVTEGFPIAGQPEIGRDLFAKYGPGGQLDAQAYGAFQKSQSRSMLEQTFGPIEEFDVYRSAFETLQGATTSAFSAWIDGSMSAGEAFKKFMGESLKGTATFLLGESIKFGLMALSSAIPGPFFNPGAASAYAATAAKYVAGAAAVGGLAKVLGGSGGGGGGASVGAAPTGSAANGMGGGGGNQYIVTYGDSFADDSPLMRQRNARKLIETVMGSPGVR